MGDRAERADRALLNGAGGRGAVGERGVKDLRFDPRLELQKVSIQTPFCLMKP